MPVWAALLLALVLPLRAVAQSFDPDVPFEITAHEIEFDAESGVLVARSKVRLVQGADSLKADWVAFDREQQRGVASGNVVIVDDGRLLEAAFVHFAVEREQGFMLEGRYDTGEGGFIVEAAKLAKTGEDTYRVGEGRFTTCRCPEEEARKPWQIEAGDTDMKIGGYAFAKNTMLKVLGMPVIWLPRMIFPVKTERESGVLLPEFDIGGRNGFDVGLPIFWAPREDVGVIVTPRYLTKRGPKVDLETEAVWGKRSYSDLFAAYVYDKDIEPNTPDTPYDKHRWAVRYRHDQDLPQQLRLKADANFTSDNQYVVDFNEMRRYRVDRFLESVAFLERSFSSERRVAAIAAARWADDLQNADDLDRDDFLLQRLPDVSLSALTGALGMPALVSTLR